jgi:hypothetical protein
MVRLMLVAAPAFVLLGAIGLSDLLQVCVLLPAVLMACDLHNLLDHV